MNIDLNNKIFIYIKMSKNWLLVHGVNWLTLIFGYTN